jgi:predicted DNA-binding transcriptional regulator YafY
MPIQFSERPDSPVYRPTARVLAVLEVLQSRGRVTGRELAERVGVDPRTLRRYITILEDLGIPIGGERGRHGAYFLVAGFKLPPLMLSDEEGLAIATGVVAARAMAIATDPVALESAHAKLLRVMPEVIRTRLLALAASARIGAAAVDGTAMPGSAQTLLALAAAAHERQRIHLVHSSGKDQELTARDFDPYALAFRAQRWYTVGFCHLRHALRSFRIDRVVSVSARAERFEIPAGFDALAFLNDSIASLPRTHVVEVLLATDLDGARAALMPALGLFETVPGATRLRSQTDDLAWYACRLAHLPFEFSVVSPPELADALREQAARLSRAAATRATPAPAPRRATRAAIKRRAGARAPSRS